MKLNDHPAGGFYGTRAQEGNPFVVQGGKRYFYCVLTGDGVEGNVSLGGIEIESYLEAWVQHCLGGILTQPGVAPGFKQTKGEIFC